MSVTDMWSLLREVVEPAPDVARMDVEPLVERLQDARVILIGGATYGTSEAARVRARLTRGLIVHGGVTTLAIAGSVPEAWWLDRFVGDPAAEALWPPPVGAFPSWVWRNGETFGFLRWLQQHNRGVLPHHRIAIRGLDLLDFYDSAASMLECLEVEAPEAARQVRARLACIAPWLGDPAGHREMTYPEGVRRAEAKVLAVVRRRLERRLKVVRREQNGVEDSRAPRLPSGSTEFFQSLYRGSAASWNARQQQMFETLMTVVDEAGPDGKVVVWALNPEVGDAAATSLEPLGQRSLGQRCRDRLGDDVRLVGFGVAGGSLTAAESWGGPPRSLALAPAHEESYEHVFESTLLPAAVLSLREPAHGEVRGLLSAPRLERAVGPVYQSATERVNHYFQASLCDQFDEYVWIREGHPLMAVPEPPRR
jgi:erythromycin esterase-like protein